MTIVQAHAVLSSSATLISARRVVYRLAAEGLGLPEEISTAGPDAVSPIDSPLYRNAVHKGLISAAATEGGQARLSRWPLGARSVGFETRRIPLLGVDDADSLLADVLSALNAESVSFLTEGDGARFDSAFAILQDGVALAEAVSPAIAADLLAHVSLVAFLRSGERTAPVLSASLREFPGLLMLIEPQNAHEAAEALLHEAAHSRFFDMAIVHDLLPADCDAMEQFEPSWRPGAHWPVEQAVAALHAYSVLAEFAADLGRSGTTAPPWGDSLLPHAAERAVEIGDWVDARLEVLGRDMAAFVDRLRGRPTVRVPLPIDPAVDVHGQSLRVVAGLRVTPLDGGGVVAATGIPARLFVLGSDSGLVLNSLIQYERDNPVRAAVTALSEFRAVSRSEALAAVHGILESLLAMSLVELPADGPCAAAVRRQQR